MTTSSLASPTPQPESLPGVTEASDEREILTFPHGLAGFDECRSFVLFRADDAPFQWLTSVEGPAASFLTVDPRALLPTFRFVLGPGDLRRLKASDETPLVWLAIVLVEADGTVTANLRAPIVINPTAMLGQQVMPHDCLYPLRHLVYSPTA